LLDDGRLDDALAKMGDAGKARRFSQVC